MTWPKKNTRRLHIDGAEYSWNLRKNRIDGKPVRITVGQQDARFYLWIDPYVHDFEVTPQSIKNATRWALENGWSPKEGPSRAMSLSMETNDFYWLPEGTEFGYEIDERNQDEPGRRS